MKKLQFLFLFSIIFSIYGCNNQYPNLDNGLYAEFVTNKGTFVAELYYKEVPMTVASFVALAEGTMENVNEDYKGKKFYDSLTFHRVIKDFMIQGGDPLGTGAGGPGYRFPDEINDSLQHDSAGILSMANSGPNTNGSQFFITLKETPWLNGIHTVYGKVVEGMDVVNQIGQVETNENNRPLQDIVIEELNIIRKGSDAKNFNAPQIFSDMLEETRREEEEQRKVQQEAMQQAVERLKEKEDQAEVLRSGLKIYFDEKNEDGQKPNPGETVYINYAGFLRDGTLFDTNMEEVAKQAGIYNEDRKQGGGYEPMPATYGPEAPMIPGFKEGLQQMKVGEKATIFVPSHLAYGPRGAGNIIPPNSDLIFELEIVSVE